MFQCVSSNALNISYWFSVYGRIRPNAMNSSFGYGLYKHVGDVKI